MRFRNFLKKGYSVVLLCLACSIFAGAQCVAEFDYEPYDGPMPVLGGVTFTNLSTGDYTEVSWDFGDGIISSEMEETSTHFYSEGGEYNVKLTIWDGANQDCFSEVTHSFTVIISDDPCDQLDCVWPGDANSDHKANLEDLLNIGVGFGAIGPERDNASGDWNAQPAEDWDFTTGDGINYKHLDCNGDGIIDYNDIDPVQLNYVIMDNGISETESNNPPIYLEFDVDTVFVTDEDATFSINAGLMFGHSELPMEDIYGIALYLEYPDEYVDSSSVIMIDYNEASFFGDLATETLPYAKDNRENGQVDMVVTRKNGINTSGYGRVASLNFIVISDIIDGRVIADGEPFKVGIKVAKAIDSEGNEMDISLSGEPACVFFVNDMTNGYVEPDLSNQVSVRPNPASTSFQIDVQDLGAERIELFNLVGQSILTQTVSDRITTLNVSQLEGGVYLLHVYTPEGIATKRVVIR